MNTRKSKKRSKKNLQVRKALLKASLTLFAKEVLNIQTGVIYPDIKELNIESLNLMHRAILFITKGEIDISNDREFIKMQNNYLENFKTK